MPAPDPEIVKVTQASCPGTTEPLFQRLRILRDGGDQRYIGITLKLDDPLWRDFRRFLCVCGLDVESALRHILRDWITRERRRLQRVGRQKRIICKECGCKKWVRRRRVGRNAYNLRCVRCNCLMRVTEKIFSEFSDEDLKKTFPLEKDNSQVLSP